MTPHDEPYELLLAYHEGRLDEAERRRVEGLVEANQVYKAHLGSLELLEVDRTLALRDGVRLRHFGLADATDFCQRVARQPGDVLPPLLVRRRVIGGIARKEWNQHLKSCAFCSVVLRQEEARAQAEKAGLKASPLLRDWLLGPYFADALRHATDRLRSDFQDVAVMFVDLVGSTPYGEQFGGQMSYYLSERLEGLLREAVREHRGAWERIEGDGALFFFERAEDAARCAVALQGRLATYNEKEAESKAHLMYVRIGIHYGRCRLVRRHGQWRLYGPVANTAKRVEQAGAGEDSPILLSRTAVAELPANLFPVRPFRTVQAKGMSEGLELYRLFWRDRDAALAQREPAAEIRPAPEPLDNLRAVATILLGPGGGRVARVQVRSGRAPRGEVRSLHPSAPGVEQRARQAVIAAFRAVEQFGLPAASSDEYVVEWSVEGAAGPLEGTSFELALAVATAASLTGGKAPRVIVAGAVEGDKAEPVERLEEKAVLLLKAPRDQARRRPFEKLLLPEANYEELPAHLRREHFYVENKPFRCVAVATVGDAVREALGGTLGAPEAAIERLTAAVRGGASAVSVELWVEREDAPSIARDLILRCEGGKAGYRWKVGDRLLTRVRVDRDCYLSLFNVNPLGQVTVLLPNEKRKVAAARASEAAAFPGKEDDLDYELAPPTGLERMIALATVRPLPLSPSELGQDEGLFCARLAGGELEELAERYAPYVLGTAEIDFQVEEAPAPPSGARTGPSRGVAEDDEDAWVPFDLG